MYCPYCGKQLIGSERFCGSCGNKMPNEVFQMLTNLKQPEENGEPDRARLQEAENTRILRETYEAEREARQARQEREQRISDRNLQVRRAYSRAGIGVMVMFGIYSLIQSIALEGGMFFSAFPKLIKSEPDFFASDNPFEIVQSLFSGGNMFWVMTAVAISCVVGMAIGLPVERKIIGKQFYCPPEKRKLSFPQFLLMALVALGVWFLGVMLGNFSSFFYTPVNDMEQLYGTGMIPFSLYAMFGAPVFEELGLRKIALDRLGKFGEAPAVLVTALLFGMIHGNSGQFFLAFFLGLLFGVIYLKTGKIIYTMLLHFLINTTASVPSLLTFLNVNVEPVYDIVVYSVGGVGLVLTVILLAKKYSFFRTTPPVATPPARKQIFANPGMRIAVIIGLVLLVFTDLETTFLELMAGNFPALLQLISTGLAVALILVVFTAVYKKCPEGDPYILPEENVPEGAQERET